VVHRVGVLHVAPSLDEGELFQIIIIAIGRSAHVPPFLTFVLAGRQVRQLFLRFSHFIDALFLR
jgi:hypothetical protein